MTNSTVLITGANRGLGLEFTKQYLGDSWTVVGTTRDMSEAEELSELGDSSNGRLIVETMDVTDDQSIAKVRETINKQCDQLDLLINNAGTMGSKEDFEDLTALDLETVFEVNTVGSFRVTQQMLPLLKESSGNIVMITSLMGSIEDNGIGGSYPYRISKAGLNMLGKTLSRDFKDEGIYTLLLHPGWVKTRMGGSGAKISPEKSIRGMREVISEIDESMNGEFYNYEGKKLPW